MNELPREARWSLLAAISLGLFLAGLGLGGIVGGQGLSSSSRTGGNGTYGVIAANNSTSNNGGGAVRAQGGVNDGLVATTGDAGAAAVRAQNTASNGVAVWGTNPGSGVGVYGGAFGSVSYGGPYVGVAGQSGSSAGVGVYGPT